MTYNLACAPFMLQFSCYAFTQLDVFSAFMCSFLLIIMINIPFSLFVLSLHVFHPDTIYKLIHEKNSDAHLPSRNQALHACKHYLQSCPHRSNINPISSHTIIYNFSFIIIPYTHISVFPLFTVFIHATSLAVCNTSFMHAHKLTHFSAACMGRYEIARGVNNLEWLRLSLLVGWLETSD